MHPEESSIKLFTASNTEHVPLRIAASLVAGRARLTERPHVLPLSIALGGYVTCILDKELYQQKPGDVG
ncbi:hypothetical protein M378DRAFT_157286 [Amanita muscaria Koide BX008]|uniref:Uncharacterized protein n=1 Tax=Amanita muscaria (strain Koide BX008) TaxID=946122 RepID=A0A0C2XHY0_AMAMK|nr:hypothetical protein M378DRAFT_157286 [Amanita muscaria Koide BX008]